jgi:lipopolysaccharide/colanic/teichoic acid biosynthesis glycosyltransferase
MNAAAQRRRRHDRWHRLRDRVLAALGIVTLSPVLGVIAVLVAVADGLPVLFRQTRTGRGGRPFSLVKFRSMRPGPGALVTTAGDPRVTRMGHVLRRTKLDELPQLFNVWCGEMSLVGPRPEVPRYVALQANRYAGISALRPGITDFASLALADEETLMAQHADTPDFYGACLLPRKVALARLYRRHRSLTIDLLLLAATLLRIAGARELSAHCVGIRLVRRVRHEVPPRRDVDVHAAAA